MGVHNPFFFLFSTHVGNSDVFSIIRLHKEQEKLAYCLPVILMENSTASAVQYKIFLLNLFPLEHLFLAILFVLF